MISNNNTPLEKRADLFPTEKRLWRALIRVNSLDYSTNKIGFILPGSKIKKTLYFNIKDIPQKLMNEIEKGLNKFHAPANKGVDNPRDIYIDIDSYEL